MRLMRYPSHQATGIRSLAWSFTSVYGLLFLSCAPPLFVLIAFIGTVLRGVAVLNFRRAHLHQLPTLSTHVTWLSVFLVVESILLVCLVFYGMQEYWSVSIDMRTVFLAWAWLLVMNASVLLAVMLVRVQAKRIEHELVLLQLRTTSRCVLAAIVLGALVSFVTFWVSGLDPVIVLFGLATHGLVAMVAAGHGMAAFAKLASVIRAGS